MKNDTAESFRRNIPFFRIEPFNVFLSYYQVAADMGGRALSGCKTFYQAFLIFDRFLYITNWRLRNEIHGVYEGSLYDEFYSNLYCGPESSTDFSIVYWGSRYPQWS